MVEETMDREVQEDAPASGATETNAVSASHDEDQPSESEEVGQPEKPEEEHPDEATEESMEDPLRALEAALEQTKSEADRNRTDYLRTLADMANLRKRTVREKENARKFAIEGFALDLLSVMDNVARAMEVLDAGVEVDSESGSSMKSVIEGVRMIQAELEKALSKHGVTRIKALKEPFDPNLHQAVQQLEAEGVKPGTVVQEMRAGYLLNDRLLRPAMVGVAQ